MKVICKIPIKAGPFESWEAALAAAPGEIDRLGEELRMDLAITNISVSLDALINKGKFDLRVDAELALGNG